MHECNMRYRVSEVPPKTIKSAVLSASIFGSVNAADSKAGLRLLFIIGM